ncbi:MAG: TIGR03435 family protein [Acidobacteriaceae bacterium]
MPERISIAFALALALALPTALSRAQTAPPPANVPLAFDVVSVKPAQPEPGVASSWRAASDGFSATTTVENFVQSAYNFVLDDQILNLPGWAKSERFEIAAQMDPDTSAAFNKLPRDQRDRQWDRMMQSILTDRFRMQAHSETRRMPVYALMVAKNGPRLKPAAAGSADWSAGPGRIAGHLVDMSLLSTLLSGSLGRIVVDRTGLTGHYDLTLTWTPDDQQALPDSGPSLITALEEQLGLRLQATRAPAPVLVIDHIEKPSAN